MKIRVKIKEGSIDLDEVFDAPNEDELFRQFRHAAGAHAPVMIRIAMKAMSDQALRQQVVDSYNYRFKTTEPVPKSAREFIAFGERVGFIKRL